MLASFDYVQNLQYCPCSFAISLTNDLASTTADYLLVSYHQLQSNNTLSHSRRYHLHTLLLEERTYIKYRKVTKIVADSIFSRNSPQSLRRKD